MPRTIHLAAVAISFSLAFGQPAQANEEYIEPSPGFSTTVDLSMFDFTTVEGVTGAHRRIVSTAYQLCSPLLHRVASSRQLYQACISQSVNRAVWRAGIPALSGFHAALKPSDRARIFKSAPANWYPNG